MFPPQEPCAGEEKPDLRSVQVRLLRAGERAAWDRLMRQHHYLGFRGFVGESLRYVAQWQGRWVALLGWCAAALKCRARTDGSVGRRYCSGNVWVWWSTTRGS